MPELTLYDRLGGAFDEVASVLASTLDEFNLPQHEKDQVLGAFAAHKNEVTEGFRLAAAPA